MLRSLQPVDTVSTVLTFPLGDCFALRAFKNTKARAMKGIIISVVKDSQILAKQWKHKHSVIRSEFDVILVGLRILCVYPAYSGFFSPRVTFCETVEEMSTRVSHLESRDNRNVLRFHPTTKVSPDY